MVMSLAGQRTYTEIHYEQRRLALRKILQREGVPMSTADLHTAVTKWHNTSYHIKTTRLDLKALTTATLVAPAQSPSPKSKYWKLGRGSFDLALSPSESMTLTAIFQHADRFGFRTETEQLTKLRDYATSAIRTHATRNLVAEGRITTGTRFTVLQPGNYATEHLATIQEAMLADCDLEVVYRPRDAGDVQCTYHLKPLMLSYQDSNVYLTAYIASETWPQGHEPEPDTPRGKYSSNGPGKTCALMLHRMLGVRTTFLKIPDRAAFDAGSLAVQKDLMTIHGDTPIHLQLRLSPNLLNRLTENPLDQHQQVTTDAQGGTLECRVMDTQGLRLFLLSNAADIEVMAPGYLREHVRHTLATALERYQNSP